MAPIPTPSHSQKPLKYAEKQNWPDFSTTLEKAKLPAPMIKQHKKRIEAIAPIADQIRWTCSQMKPEYWPTGKTDLAMQFFMSNLIQLRIVCHEPLLAIREHINKNCPELMGMDFGEQNVHHWLMPAKRRQTESPIAEPIAISQWKQAQDEEEKEDAEKVTKTPPEPKRIQTEEEKAEMKKREAASFFEEEDKIRARQQQVATFIDDEVGHFEYETPEMQAGQTWEDALRSTMRTYDAAQMEIERHYRLIGYTKTKSQWPLDRIDVLAKKSIPTRSNQELLLEIALQHKYGPPTAKTRAMMENWATEKDVRISLPIHLGRFLLPEASRHWTNYFTHSIDHQSAAEPSMFFICQHEYSEEVAKWIVGGTTPHTGVHPKVKWKWADELYKAVREQGMGKNWVGRVNQANDRQRELETELMGLPAKREDPDQTLFVRQQVIATLREDPAHQRLVARINCKGLSINRSMVPTQCCYRCQSNFQYIVLSAHMKTTDAAAISHLRKYSWKNQCGWDQQCAEALAACQCTHFDDEQNELNRPRSSRPKAEGGRTLKSKKSTISFKFNR
ncbi:unnamed protein product [Alternaria alternata]